MVLHMQKMLRSTLLIMDPLPRQLEELGVYEGARRGGSSTSGAELEDPLCLDERAGISLRGLR
jgi:hypothetical protein